MIRWKMEIFCFLVFFLARKNEKTHFSQKLFSKISSVTLWHFHDEDFDWLISWKEFSSKISKMAAIMKLKYDGENSFRFPFYFGISV